MRSCRSGRTLVASALAATLFAPVADAQQARLKGVRFWSAGEISRVAIETTAEIEYRSERVVSPERIFFDLEGTRPALGKRGVETIPADGKLLKSIRIAETQPGVVRVVLDLAAPVEYSVSQLRNPARLIVEVRPSPAPPQLPPALPPPPDVQPRSPATQLPPAAHTPITKPEPQAAAPTFAPVRAATSAPKGEPVQTASTPKRTSAPAKSTEPPAKSTEQPAKSAEPPVPPQPVALAAKRDSAGERSLIRTLGLKLARVVLDPGHGGHDTGTIGRGGLMEKDLVLDVAKRLGMLIELRLGSEVTYTRTDDTFIPLEERTAFAMAQQADLFLSIHANSSRAAAVAGPETFYLNFTTDEDALEVASRENATSSRSIKDYPDLVQKIALNEKVHESRELAASIQKSLHAGLARSRGLRNRGVKKAPFVVLIGAQIPSVLTEIAFLSNPRDENLLKRPDYRQKIAEALFRGVSQWADTLSHYKVAQQATPDGAQELETRPASLTRP